MALIDAEELGFEEASPRRLGRWRRAASRRGHRHYGVAIVVMGLILVGATLTILGLTFIQGSWWYSYGTDRPLDDESLAQVEAIRNAVEASGAAPEAVRWLDAALDPGADPTDVRTYLITAQEAMKAAGAPELVEAASELQATIGTIRSPMLLDFDATTTPYAVSTPEWP